MHAMWDNHILDDYTAVKSELQLLASTQRNPKNIMLNKRSHRRIYIVFLNTALKIGIWGFPGGAVVENLPANAGDTGASPGLGRSHMPRSN